MSKILYLAGTGHSDGGFHQMEIFDSLRAAMDHAEAQFNTEKKWTIEADGNLYYGFEDEWKGFVTDKQLNPD